MFKKIVWLWFSSHWKNAKDVKKYIDSLVEWGANEFMTGYNPPYWYEKFWFEVSPNMRFAEHEQITDFETLKLIVESVHSHNLEIFVNLNFRYYTDETWPLIEKMIWEFRELWVDGIITSSISVLEYLKNINYTWKINISTIMALYNKESIRFFLENYKINKIILSREITLKEIESIVNEFKDTKFEIFWEWDFCRYNNWLCFAEHKYSNKDICTVVVNDLIIKGKFRPDFKKIILDNADNLTITDLIDVEYEDIFEQIEKTLNDINLDCWISIVFDEWEEIPEDRSINNMYKVKLKKLVEQWKNRVDLYFDAMKPINAKHNQNIITFLKALKYLNLPEYKDLQEELKNSFRTWVNFLIDKTIQIWWTAKLRAEELRSFYARSDNLNLYSYLFFSKFPNIDTVKFPTRWRNYNEKIKVIEDVLKAWKVDEKYLDRWISLERAHYDLSYLFGDKKLWFREIVNG